MRAHIQRTQNITGTGASQRRLRRGRIEYIVIIAGAATAMVFAMWLGLQQRRAQDEKSQCIASLTPGAQFSPHAPRQPIRELTPRLVRSLPTATQQLASYVAHPWHPAETPATSKAIDEGGEPTPACADTAALIQEVEQLRRQLPQSSWPNYVLDALDRLHTLDANQEEDALAELVLISRDPLLERIQDESLAGRAEATRSAVHRRAVIWQQLHRIAHSGPTSRAGAGINAYAMWLQIHQAVGALPHPQSQAWRDYLRMDELEARMCQEPATSDELAELARLILERMHSPRLNERQRELLSSTEMRQLAKMLRACATRPANIAAVVSAIERFENDPSQADAGRLARLALEMRWSLDAEVAELARRIDELYRGPNLRLSVSAELLNRLLGQTRTATDPIRQQSQQGQLVGQRQTQTDLAVRLVPADDQWRLHLVADGKVTSDTTVYAGPATFFVTGAGSFQSTKLLAMDRSRVDRAPAQATGEFDLRLAGYQTSMDTLPLFGQIVRDSALSQYQQQQGIARQRVQAQLREEASQALDRQVEAYLGEVEATLEARALRPLRQLGLALIPVRLQTSPQQIAGEYVLAGPHHIGAPAPPPAPVESLITLQIHQSSINNVLEELQLPGRCGSLQELARDFCAGIGLAAFEQLEAVPAGIALQMSSEQPLRVEFNEGNVQVACDLAEFSVGEKRWPEIKIRWTYRVDRDSRPPALVRDGKVEVDGRQLGAIDRMLLEGIFARMLACTDRVPLLPQQLADHPGLADVAVTQCRIEDGWFAIALGRNSP